MLDIILLRNQLDEVVENLKQKGFSFDKDLFNNLDHKKRTLQVAIEQIRAQKNQITKKIAALSVNRVNSANSNTASLSSIEPIDSLLIKEKKISSELTALEVDFRSVNQKLHDYLSTVPNLLDKSVPVGLSSLDNQMVHAVGEAKQLSFQAKDHIALTKNMGIDLQMGAKLSGSRFVVLDGDMARLNRALSQFMLDTHIERHGYTEVSVPFLVNQQSMYNTGQLPKFANDAFAVTHNEQNLYLIPTAEVPVTNLLANHVVGSEQLPVKLVCHSSCFRREAGSYGKDTQGLIRTHQFDKVELVQAVKPDQSAGALEALLLDAENILKLLDIPYRVMLLCSSDTGFASAKTYDIEVWMPVSREYREISSCSNMTDFQARRMKAKFREKVRGANTLLHTLNGSGLAIGRCLVAILENYQNADGSVSVPQVLRQYLKKDRLVFEG